ncbi:MAG: FtsX-like permease family protein [Bacteroidetes bacterium]|nr:MAG: FtsX-like permease family protein [Bacteroidota bacterium]
MQVQESIQMAFTAVKANKLRSTLTLLGIGVGVFSIIGVMTAMGVLQNAIESGLSELGSNTFQIQKFPAMSFNDNDRRRFRNRKDITYEQGEQFANKLSGMAKYVGLEIWAGGKVVGYKKIKSNPNVSVMGESVDGLATNNWNIADGRSFNRQEEQSADRVAVLGDGIRKLLFPTGNPVGELIRVDGQQFRVIGTIAPKGAVLGGNQGNFVVIPISTHLSLYGRERSINIMVTAKDQDTYNDVLEHSRSVMRVIRQVPPGEPDDFEFFSNETMISTFNDMTFMIKIGTLGIACIALIAAGVGIMNIMLVSVTERTKEIGVRKSLGATKSNVLTQFLTESVVFSQIGGVIGIITGSMLGNVVALLMSAPPILPWNNEVAILQTPILDFTALQMNITALIFCSFIGIVFGVYPAWKAANLDPIEALRYE